MSDFVGCLLPHQEKGVEFLVRTPRAFLADEVGLGKTVQAAAAIARLRAAGGLRNGGLSVLWLTTASLIGQTVEELERFLPGLNIGTRFSPAPGGPGCPVIRVVSHDYAQRNFGDLDCQSFSLVVVDEASALRGGGVKWEAARDLCARAGRVIVMTATPMENHPLELWHVTALTGLEVLGSKESFEGKLQITHFRDGRRRVRGWKNEYLAEWAMNRLRPHFLRRTHAEVEIPLPHREELQLVLVPLTDAGRREYWQAGRIGQPLRRHQAEYNAGIRASSEGRDVFTKAVEIAGQRARSGHKVVIYTERLAGVARLVDLLEEHGLTFVSLTGELKPAEREAAVARFREEPETRIMVGSRVIEHGLNLQMADTLITVNPSYNPAREHQREGRLSRIGSPHETYRHYIVAPDTRVTRRLLETLKRKEQGTRAFLNSRQADPPADPRPRIVPKHRPWY